jgi:hypothetical protein
MYLKPSNIMDFNDIDFFMHERRPVDACDNGSLGRQRQIYGDDVKIDVIERSKRFGFI